MTVCYEHWLLPRRRDFRPTNEGVARLVAKLREERWVLTPDHPFWSDNGTNGVPHELRGGYAGGYANRFGKNPKWPDDPSAVIDPRRIPRSKPATDLIPVPMPSTWLDERLDPGHSSVLAREIALIFPVFPTDQLTEWAEVELRYPFTVGGDDGSNGHELVILLADDFVSHRNNAFDIIDARCACGLDGAYDPSDPQEFTPAIGDQRIRRICPGCGAVFDPSTRTAAHLDGFRSPDETGRSELRGGITFRFAVRIDCSEAWPREGGRPQLGPDFLVLVENVLEEGFEDIGDTY